MPLSISRRSFSAGSVAAVVAGVITSRTGLGGAQNGGAFSGLNLPNLDITVTADGFGGVAEQVEAGRYLVTITPEDDVEAWGAGFVQPPEELTADQFVLELQSASIVEPQDEAGEQATPDDDVLPAGAPVVAYDALFAGGVIGTPGSSELQQVVLDLTPGEWVLWAGEPTALQAPLIFEVTGEMPGGAAEPEADIAVTLSDAAITFDGELTAGEHVLQIVHEGEEPHHLEIMKGPDGMTEDEIGLVLEASAGQDVDAVELPFDPETDLTSVLITAEQSMGAVQWVPVTLESGTYVAACFFPAVEDSAPHALRGEYTVLTVE